MTDDSSAGVAAPWDVGRTTSTWSSNCQRSNEEDASLGASGEVNSFSFKRDRAVRLKRRSQEDPSWEDDMGLRCMVVVVVCCLCDGDEAETGKKGVSKNHENDRMSAPSMAQNRIYVLPTKVRVKKEGDGVSHQLRQRPRKRRHA